MKTDARGLAVTCSDARALLAYERSLAAARSYTGDPLAPLDEAITLAPDFAAARVAKALLLMTLFERRFSKDALATLDAAEPHLAGATPREKALAAAARQLATGEWSRAATSLDRILAEWPRDILAIQVGHLVDFIRGDHLNLRNRISRVLPQWSVSLPGHSFVLGMHAFGLEECNQYPQAEATGMRALEAAPEDAWAVHAVVHVMEMQGRVAEGMRFLQGRKKDWAAPDNGFAFHNWWHLALFHLDGGDIDAVLGIYDEVLVGPAHDMALSRVDATAMLWRLHLEGANVAARFEKVADAWEASLEGEGGYYAFNDFHAAMAFAAAGRERSIAALREKLDAAAWEKSDNGEMTRAVGMDASEAVIAFAQGRYDRAVDCLLAVRDGAWRFGGSHAQRDVLTLTLIEAARRCGQPRLAHHFANERRVHKPGNAWGERIVRRLEPVAAKPATLQAA